MQKKTIRRPICGYCNGCKKLVTIRRPVCEYYNGCKKLATITKPICGYCIFEWPYGNYNRKDVSITQCPF